MAKKGRDHHLHAVNRDSEAQRSPGNSARPGTHRDHLHESVSNSALCSLISGNNTLIFLCETALSIFSPLHFGGAHPIPWIQEGGAGRIGLTNQGIPLPCLQ